MSLLHILILGIVQGLAELLPVSSSAHVVVTEKLLGLDPSSPPMTLLLVMLHTGTMFAVIAYFWRSWRTTYFRSWAVFKQFFGAVVLATVLTGVIGEGMMVLIEHTLLRSVPHAQIEDLFGRLQYIAPALAIAGVLIIVAGLYQRRQSGNVSVRGRLPVNPDATIPATAQAALVRPTLWQTAAGPAAAAALAAEPLARSVLAEPVDAAQAVDIATASELTARQAGIIGAIQGLSLPFRGFSRSGATISTGLLLGISRTRAEIFSFALAVVLTPPVVAREALRLLHAPVAQGDASLGAIAVRSLFGALVAFVAGLAALRWLSRWLEHGRWHLFGVYCLAAAGVVAVLHHMGF
jgi:undecaprenyl-diphosphatase